MKMADKKKKTRGQMAEAKRMSGQAGRILAYETYVNPGVGAVFPKTGRRLTVSEELAAFRADPMLLPPRPTKGRQNPKPKKKG